MNAIQSLIDKYVSEGHPYLRARELAAQELFLRKLADSGMADKITLKGGIVMFRITGDQRRATRDLDLDFIRYPLDEDSIKSFVESLNYINDDDDVGVKIVGRPKKLKHENYQGLSVTIRIYELYEHLDISTFYVDLKLDIGIHTYSSIPQRQLVFYAEEGKDGIALKANPCEQIFVEKALTLARLGAASTRYKDIYDMAYFIKESILNKADVEETLALFLENSKRGPHDLYSFQLVIEEVLGNKQFAKEASKPLNAWLDMAFEEARRIIVDFIWSL